MRIDRYDGGRHLLCLCNDWRQFQTILLWSNENAQTNTKEKTNHFAHFIHDWTSALSLLGHSLCSSRHWDFYLVYPFHWILASEFWLFIPNYFSISSNWREGGKQITSLCELRPNSFKFVCGCRVFLFQPPFSNKIQRIFLSQSVSLSLSLNIFIARFSSCIRFIALSIE